MKIGLCDTRWMSSCAACKPLPTSFGIVNEVVPLPGAAVFCLVVRLVVVWLVGVGAAGDDDGGGVLFEPALPLLAQPLVSNPAAVNVIVNVTTALRNVSPLTMRLCPKTVV